MLEEVLNIQHGFIVIKPMVYSSNTPNEYSMDQILLASLETKGGGLLKKHWKEKEDKFLYVIFGNGEELL